MPTDFRPLRVISTALVADEVVSFTFADPRGQELPQWAPGAHIDVRLPSGTVRQYSLCGDPEDRSTYRIAVLADAQGRGGSLEVHGTVRAGELIDVGQPRQNFELIGASQYVFVAGGIGITPILPMIKSVQKQGLPWRLIYAARSSSRFAFADELAALDAEAVTLYPEDERGRLDLDVVLKEAEDATIYCCGPSGLLDAIEQKSAAGGQAEQLHVERFSLAVSSAPLDEDEIAVELAQSGIRVVVPANLSILEAVRQAGVDVPSSCEQGICGTCETRVLAGCVDHRDSLLTAAEREAGDVMMPCVSRALGAGLTLDL